MPKAAIELNAADYIEPLDKISHLIFELMEKRRQEMRLVWSEGL